MIKNKKKFIFKALILGMSILLMNTEVFSVIYCNGSGNGYGGGGGRPSVDSTKENYIIESYIEEGGGYFLNAFSNIMSISNRIEMANLQGIDYEELKQMVDNALHNIVNAKATYSILIQIALNTPYDPEVILKLKSFDYKAFMTVHSLNSVIFQEVEEYLKNGDITGTFIRIYTNFINIERLLESVKDEVSLNKMPTLPTIWEINEEASKSLTFGQYITRIFYAL